MNKIARQLKKDLQDLVKAVEISISLIDAEMGKTSSCERGKRIAKIINDLEMEKDLAKHFGLGIEFKKKK